MMPLTRGPWRFEVSRKSKGVQLVGGSPRFDMTVFDLVRWGMNRAALRFRDGTEFGLLTHVDTFTAPVAGREHHESWHRRVVHPDAQAIEDAPAMALALEMLRVGVAYLIRSDAGAPTFVFDGEGHAVGPGSCWTDLLNRIGWNRVRQALTARATTVELEANP